MGSFTSQNLVNQDMASRDIAGRILVPKVFRSFCLLFWLTHLLFGVVTFLNIVVPTNLLLCEIQPQSFPHLAVHVTFKWTTKPYAIATLALNSNITLTDDTANPSIFEDKNKIQHKGTYLNDAVKTSSIGPIFDTLFSIFVQDCVDHCNIWSWWWIGGIRRPEHSRNIQS